MLNFVNELLQFVWAVISHWQAYMTGGIIMAALFLYERIWNKTVSSRVVIVGVIAFLLAAFFMAWREQHQKVETMLSDSLRPAFFVDAPQWSTLEGRRETRIQIPMENVGAHSANNYMGKVAIFDQSLSTKPSFVDEFSVGNELIPKVPHPYYNSSVMFYGDNIPPQFCVFAIRYDDVLTQREYRQVFVYKWSGTTNKVGDDRFTEVSISERTKALEHVRILMAEYL